MINFDRAALCTVVWDRPKERLTEAETHRRRCKLGRWLVNSGFAETTGTKRG